jgi:endonuclease-3
MRKQERYALTIEKLKELFPNADTELHYETPFQLLVAVILSAQCTDKRVNIVTPALFERYASVKSMAESSQEEIYSYIKSISYPNSKSRNLKKMAERLHEIYHDEIPDDPQELQTLAGVGRKTANVFLSEFYNDSYIAVDTHVNRVSKRLKLASVNDDVYAVEKKLMKYFVKDLWAKRHLQLVLFGRYYCKAVKPLCSDCKLKDICKEKKKNL